MKGVYTTVTSYTESFPMPAREIVQYTDRHLASEIDRCKTTEHTAKLDAIQDLDDRMAGVGYFCDLLVEKNRRETLRYLDRMPVDTRTTMLQAYA